MTFSLRFVVLAIFTTVVLLGCAEDQASKPPAKKAAAAPKSNNKPIAQPIKVAEEAQEEFVYNAEGRRDPFIPLSIIRAPLTKVVDNEPKTPLQSYDVSQFRLIGVIVGKGEPKAMVVAPDGQSYVIAKGIKIGKNNGIIIDITSEAVSVAEKYYDFSGNVIENIQEIVVPRREGV